jgi:hypothetical protein
MVSGVDAFGRNRLGAGDAGAVSEQACAAGCSLCTGRRLRHFTRAMAPGLSELWGQPVVVENKPGGNEIIAAGLVKQSPPDGYTLYIASEAGLINNIMLYANLPYDPAKDFTPITRMIDGQLVYVVRRHSCKVPQGVHCLRQADRQGDLRISRRRWN